MARQRTIKPGFFKNEHLCSLSPFARLLFAGLWTISDRQGRLEDRPKRLKAEILPYDTCPECDGDDLIRQLSDAGFITRYVVDGKGFIEINNFLKHQNPHPKESPSEIPPKPSSVKSNGNSVASNVISVASNALPSFPSSPSFPSHTLERARPSGDARVRPLAGNCIDDGFGQFRSTAESAGMEASEPDWSQARWCWKSLDFEQQASAVDGILKRQEAGEYSDPQFVGLPHNYLKDRKWMRPIRAPAPTKTNGRAESTMEKLKKAGLL